MKMTIKQKPSFKTSWENFEDGKLHEIEVYHNVDKTDGKYYTTIIIDEKMQYVVERYNKDKYKLLNGDENNLSQLLGEIDQHWNKLCKLYETWVFT
jgi:hypothetical protein